MINIVSILNKVIGLVNSVKIKLLSKPQETPKDPKIKVKKHVD
jgi:hypothetical protein